MNRRILQLAIPSIVSNITVPLLGLVDVTIVGHLGSAAYIGAIAVGGLLFNILYWNFGFLRMGTSGLTSQAYGRKDADAEVKVLVQAVSVGLISAAAILILQYPVERLAFYLLDTSPEGHPFHLHAQDEHKTEATDNIDDIDRDSDIHGKTGILHSDKPSLETIHRQYSRSPPNTHPEIGDGILFYLRAGIQ